MSTNLRENITTRYGEQQRSIYEQVMALVTENSIPKSKAQLLLVKRGLQHTQNPEPLVKTVKEVVEKVVPRDRYSYCKDCTGKPKVDTSTQEPISLIDHITDESIGGGHKTGQHLSGDTLMTQDEADSPNKKASEAKKSPEGVSGEEKKGIGGWIALGGFLTVIFAPMVYRWCTRKQTEPVNQIGAQMGDQIGQPNEFTEQIDRNPYI